MLKGHFLERFNSCEECPDVRVTQNLSELLFPAAAPTLREQQAELSPASPVVSACVTGQLYFSNAFKGILFAQVSLKIKFSI